MTTWNRFVLDNKEKTTDRALISDSFTITRNPAFAHFSENTKKAI